MRSESIIVVRVRPFVYLLVDNSLIAVGSVCLLSHISPVRPENTVTYSAATKVKKVWGFA